MTARAPSIGLILLGGGGHAAVVADAVHAAGGSIVGFVDDDHRAHVPGATRLGGFDTLTQWVHPGVPVHAATGFIDLRRRWLRAARGLGATVPTVIHPVAVMASSARLGAGAFVAAGAVVGPRAVVGPGVIVNTGAIVEHDAVVGGFAHVASGAVLGGGVRVERGGLIGMRAAVLPRRTVGARATVGAGAIVTHDVPARTTVTGIPARPHRPGGVLSDVVTIPWPGTPDAYGAHR